MNLTAPVSEIFFSYQGEGIYLGQPQIFVRFSGCNLECDYCDTPAKKRELLTADELVERVIELAGKYLKKAPKVISLTGGEPLLHSVFLLELLPRLKNKGFSIYLETNGTLPGEYAKIKNWVDTVAIDIKLPSSCKKAFWKQHAGFIKIAKRKSFVKVIVTRGTTSNEISRAIELTGKIDARVPFVIQPATPAGSCETAQPWQIFQWRQDALEKLKNVHVICQMHKFWRIR